MTEPLVNISEPKPGITLVELNRPQQRNALNLAMLIELQDIVNSLSHKSGQRVLILHGSGPIFCAGLDLKEATEADKVHDSAKQVAEALKALYTSPLITIAAVHGAAIAGGGGIMAACDMVVAAEGTKIGFPETRRGLVAALIMTLLNRQLADRHVRELLFAGELVSAERAHQMGLVNHVVSPHLLIEDSLALAQSVLEGAPNATVLSKQLLDELAPSNLVDDIDKALAFHLQAREGDEAAEGILAFTEKRPPNW